MPVGCEGLEVFGQLISKSVSAPFTSIGMGETLPSLKSVFSMIAICNASYYGDGFCPAPNAKIDDGLINCCSIESVNLIRSLYLLSKYKKGKHEGYKEADAFHNF